MFRTLFALMVIANPAMAQSWNDWSGDIALSNADLEDRIVGQSITFYDNGLSLYADDGSYSYTYDGGGTAYGEYELKDDGVVCVDFANGFTRCDRFVFAGDRLVLQTEKGERFPVR